MNIKGITLDFFRNYLHLEAEFDPRLNVICGENAQGKTNLLEAIGYLSGGSSHRARYDRELIQFGVDLPPRDYHVAPYSDAAKRSIRLLREALEQAVPGMWYQPNEVGLTPFPRDEAEFAAVQRVIDALAPELRDVIVYRHCDSFDITPDGITKKTGLARLGALLGIPAEETICVGDGVNDYPMFEYGGLAIGVHVKDEEKVDRNFASISDALAFLEDAVS